MEEKMKVIVAHPEQQHSYQLATALNKKKHLYAYITTVYNKKGSLTYFLTKILPKKYKTKAILRHCNELDDNQVIQFGETLNLIKLFCQYNSFLKKHFYLRLRKRLSDNFAKKVANYAIKEKVDVVVTYDDTSPLLFEILEKQAPSIIRVLDVSAANPKFIKPIYEKDFIISPSFSDLLRTERPMIWNKDRMDRCMREVASSNFFLVPSQFVKKSLLAQSIDPKSIYICPYGIDLEKFYLKKYEDYSSIKARPIRFIYVGGFKEMKGISYLLEAFRSISKEQAVLSVVGYYDNASSLFNRYKNDANFLGFVDKNIMPKVLRENDVFVFPSLSDSYGFSPLEAAASGLPIIISENTGMKDLLVKDEGFVIQIQNSEVIRQKVLWFCNNREKIQEQGINARRMAEKASLEAYYSNIYKAFLDLEKYQVTHEYSDYS